ncbi:MAG: hypothetical protein Ct9H300mP1_37110 [Planctomycetaceae bacterium]|nr:MAG: hypothetical protein Ct9H300mP1_37110 [Planctomycetaceae bacterium]
MTPQDAEFALSSYLITPSRTKLFVEIWTFFRCVENWLTPAGTTRLVVRTTSLRCPPTMPVSTFHPLIQKWFASRFDAPTQPQAQGWPAIAAGEHTLIAAPTGSGKTLTAFLAVIDRLLREGLENGGLDDTVRVVYVSPLRALSNDMHRNLELPLEEILELGRQEGYDMPKLRVGLRTGDTSSWERTKLVRRPPQILVTTPESLFLMLTAEKSRQTLGEVDTLIVDEIHALVRDKRGSHLSFSVERLEAHTSADLQRIGLSATQKPNLPDRVVPGRGGRGEGSRR